MPKFIYQNSAPKEEVHTTPPPTPPQKEEENKLKVEIPIPPTKPDKQTQTSITFEKQKDENEPIKIQIKENNEQTNALAYFTQKIDPQKPIQIIYNFTNDTDPKKAQDALTKAFNEQKKKNSFSNTIIITVSMDGKKTELDKAKLASIHNINKGLDQLLRNESTPQNIAKTIFILEQNNNLKQSEKIIEEYKKADPQTKAILVPLIEEKYNISLEELSEALAEQSDTESAESEDSTSSLPSQDQSKPVSSAPSSSYSPFAPTSQTSEIPPPSESTSNFNESNEVQIPDKLIALGDSLLLGAVRFGKLKGKNQNLDCTKVGKTSIEMVNELGLNTSPPHETQLSKQISSLQNATAVILFGTNDLAAGKSAEETFANLQKIYSFLKQNNIKVNACTVPPFNNYHFPKNNTGRSPQFERQKLNNFILSSLNTENGPTNIINLHETVDKGGVASSENPELLDANLKANPNDLHPATSTDSNSGYNLMSSQIGKQLQI